MSPSTLQLASPLIRDALNTFPSRVLRQKDLAALLDNQRTTWRLPQRIGLTKFVKYLLEHTQLTRVHLPLAHRKETLYLWGDVPLLVVALAAKPKSYLTHFTAMGLHALTSQVSKTVYVNVEQRPQPSDPSSLSQQSIDRAFAGQQRRTRNVVDYKGHRLMYLNGKFTNDLGVQNWRIDSRDTVRVTDLERTLLDVAVRPAYSGGVAHVLEAYRSAAKRLNEELLWDYLDRIAYVYPYAQAIGYYLERAGLSSQRLALEKRKQKQFDFYLAYGMRDRSYVPEWRLFIPKGLESVS